MFVSIQERHLCRPSFIRSLETQEVLRIDALSKLVFERVSAQIGEEVTPEVIAEALLKRVVVTRQANPYELKDHTTLLVRHATPEEIRTGKRTH